MSENEVNNPLASALKAAKPTNPRPNNPKVGKKKVASKKKSVNEAKAVRARPEFVMITGTVIAEAYYDGYRLHEGDRATVKCPTSDQYPNGRVPSWLQADK